MKIIINNIKTKKRIKKTVEFKSKKNKNLFNYSKTLKNLDSIMEIDEYGNKCWRNKKGQLHRINGPALIYTNGDKEWWYNGKRHKINGPALTYYDNSKEWWYNGKRHRINGPALIWAEGIKAWYINGKKYKTEEEWKEAKKRLGLK